MYSLNKAMVIGNLTRDPESKATPSGTNVCNFSVATSQTWNDASGAKQEKTEFHNIVAWGKLADICAQYLVKGRKVFVEGRLQTRDWQAQDGSKKYRTEIVAENMIILDRAGTPAAGGTNKPAKGPEEFSNMNDVPPVAPPIDEIRVEDIPF
jgi:single-strand DNA-binding protein